MSSDTRNHSFSLQPKASEIVNEVRDQKKSAFVSDAILYYDSKKKLGEIAGPGKIPDDEAKDVLQVGGWRGVLHRIFSFHL